MQKSISMRNPSILFAILSCMVIASMMPLALGFVRVGTGVASKPIGKSLSPAAKTTATAMCFPLPMPRNSGFGRTLVSIRAERDGDEPSTDLASSANGSNPNTVQDNFDGEGFANYLLPYAVALIGSVVATAALFKFVLLDY
mmetsp:Transcript_5641/g.16200  ORF Transcript_5641/g.16200 Transcript_5641/m.16200 type:complete len:142 (-) Transcript_5641:1998-2423(-)